MTKLAELGEMLLWEKLYIFGCPEDLQQYINFETTEADARAKMLIYLIEQGLMPK